ncbi:MAG: hypothetical protein RI564_13680, partial [Gracilimonas sp.]|nr:hypothetical protein [Gracilimonas sp.]
VVFNKAYQRPVFARVAVTEWELNPWQSPGIRLLINQRFFYDTPSGIREIASPDRLVRDASGRSSF